jgi:hypothetical protein
MTAIGALFTVAIGVLLLVLPRNKAPLPLIMGASYMTLAQQILIGPLHFSVVRILVAIGIVRVLKRGERLSGGWNSLDTAMILWGVWNVCSSAFHKNPAEILTRHLGMVYEGLGIYFLFRALLTGTQSTLGMFRLVIIALMPIAVAMALEAATGRNGFSVLGGVGDYLELRGGRWRAQGPFGGAITAGTVGGSCLPMALALWWCNRRLALTGIAATGVMVMSSASSGPVMTAFSALVGLAAWKIRDHMRAVRWGIVLTIIALDIVMKTPVYYLIGRFNITGHSTGWHRAALIEAAINHLSEWWMAGTDFTRHWMPSGISDTQTDITNQYIKMGVLGGLLLMILFIRILVKAFSRIGRTLRGNRATPVQTRFTIWVLGAILFAHVITFFSVSYWDQSILFFYILLAAIGSLEMTPRLASPAVRQSAQSKSQEGLKPLSDEGSLCHHC